MARAAPTPCDDFDPAQFRVELFTVLRGGTVLLGGPKEYKQPLQPDSAAKRYCWAREGEPRLASPT
jgi:hypothetical protein